MRRISYIFLLFNFLLPVSAQKLVIGSEIPSFRSLKDDILWMTEMPEERPILIDFYQPSNPTCVANLKRLSRIAESKRADLDVVVMTKEPDESLKVWSGIKYIGVDTIGGDFFEKCHVQYLPYTMLVDEKSRLLWHGILNTLSDEMLDEILREYGR